MSGWDTSNVTEMASAFSGCASLEQLDVSGWDTSNVTDMRGMFQGCSSIRRLDVSGWNTAKVTAIDKMFDGCETLETPDITSWDLSSVTDIDEAFIAEAEEGAAVDPRSILVQYLMDSGQRETLLAALAPDPGTTDPVIDDDPAKPQDPAIDDPGQSDDPGKDADDPDKPADVDPDPAVEPTPEPVEPAVVTPEDEGAAGATGSSSNARVGALEETLIIAPEETQDGAGEYAFGDPQESVPPTALGAQDEPISNDSTPLYHPSLSQAIDQAIGAIPASWYWLALIVLALVTVLAVVSAALLVPRRDFSL